MRLCLILSVMAFAAACCNGGEENFTNSNRLQFPIYKAGTTLGYFSKVPLYGKIDSFKIVDPSGGSVKLEPYNQNGVYYFTLNNFFDNTTDPNPFGIPICKNLLFYYNAQDIDTLNLCFAAREGKCVNELRTLKAEYNSVEIQVEEVFSNGASLTIYKN